MKKKSLIILVVSIMVVIGGFFIWMGPAIGASASPLPVLGNPGHTIGDFSFLDQEGNTITRQTIRGKVCVVEYFFTTCTGICPKMNAAMEKVYDIFQHTPGFMILSHTVDPGTDSVPVLEKYAERFHADPKVWKFLTGPKKELYAMARKGYLLDASTGDGGPDDFVHTQMWALVDGQGRIRGFYDSLNPVDVKKLVTDVRSLLAEQ